MHNKVKGQNCSGKKGGGLFLLGGWQGSPESRSSSVRKRTVRDGTRFMILSRLSLVGICSNRRQCSWSLGGDQSYKTADAKG